MNNLTELLKSMLKSSKNQNTSAKISFPQLAELALNGDNNQLAKQHFGELEYDESMLFLKYIREHQDIDERLIILKNLTN